MKLMSALVKKKILINTVKFKVLHNDNKEPNKDKRIKYSSQLDSLREIAVILTLICHWMGDIWNIRIQLFEYGVDIFFGISGFLITSILIKEKKELSHGQPHGAHLKKFFLRRFLRLMPVYFLYLIGILLLGKIIGFTPWPEGTGIYFFTYLPNILMFFKGSQSPMVNHFWSLGVEEQFYLLWPFLVFFLSTKSLKYVLFFIIAFGVVIHIIPSSFDVRYLPFGNFHTLGFGALLAFYNEFEPIKIKFLNKYKGYLILGSLFVLLVTITKHSPLLVGLHQTSLFFMAGILTMGTYLQWNGPVGLFFNNVLFQWIGKISYGIYVFHKPVHYLFGPWLIKISFFNNGIMLMVIYSFIIFAFASLSYKYFEMPFLKLKKKFN